MLELAVFSFLAVMMIFTIGSQALSYASIKKINKRLMVRVYDEKAGGMVRRRVVAIEMNVYNPANGEGEITLGDGTKIKVVCDPKKPE